MANRLTKGKALVGAVDVPTDQLYINSTAVTASAAELNRAADISGRIVDATSSTLSVTEATHEGRIVTLNRAAGIAVTLPAATGGGAKYRFIIGTTITSNSTTVKVANANDTMFGMALLNQDSAETVVGFEATAGDDTITLNGTTTGGIKGATVECVDMAANEWWVRVISDATGTEATPFSATVS